MSKEKSDSMIPQGGIAAAIVKAQGAIVSVSKDATVDFGRKYNYTSAEEMIRESRRALHGAGLALMRTAWRLRVVESTPIVECDYILAHTGGETMTFCDLPWPVIEGDKRPIDKAVAGALTTSLAYFLRDLLLIPKQDEAEMDKRDDSQHAAGALGVRGAVALRKRLSSIDADQAMLVEVMGAKGVTVPDDMAQWSQSLLPRIDKWIEGRAKTIAQPAE